MGSTGDYLLVRADVGREVGAEIMMRGFVVAAASATVVSPAGLPAVAVLLLLLLYLPLPGWFCCWKWLCVNPKSGMTALAVVCYSIAFC